MSSRPEGVTVWIAPSARLTKAIRERPPRLAVVLPGFSQDAAAPILRDTVPRLLTVLKLVAFVAAAWLVLNVLVIFALPAVLWLFGI